MTMKPWKLKTLWDAASEVLRGKFIAILPQETRKTLNRLPNFMPKTTDKRRTKNPQISKTKEIIKIRAEIIEKEMKQ